MAKLNRTEVLGELRHDITTGRIAPGGHLTEAGLAETYELSRTPIRWILRQLANEGLVTVEPNRGAFVAEWIGDDAAEVMAIRALLESRAAGLAAQRSTPAQRVRLKDLRDQMEDLWHSEPEGFRNSIAVLNHEFHLAVLESAASPRLYNSAKDLVVAPLMSGSFQYYSPTELERSMNEHRMLVDAIDHGDAEYARSLMESHLRGAYSSLSRGPGHTS